MPNNLVTMKGEKREIPTTVSVNKRGRPRGMVGKGIH